MYIRPDRAKVNPTYLSYFLNEHRNKERLLNQVHGRTRKALTKGTIENFEVKIPSLDVQDKIADILGSLDEKIKLNFKMNQTIEEFTMRLYKHWFVDFGPFEESEIEKWDNGNLNDYCELNTDGAHASPKEVPNTRVIATVKNMDKYSFRYDECKQISDEDFYKLVAGNCQPQKGDVLLSKDGTIGNVLFVPEKEVDLVLLSSIAILRPKFSPYYLYLYLMNPNTKSMILNGYSSGSALTRLVLKSIKMIPILIPPASILREFDNKVGLLIEKIMKNEKENINLKKTREYLLPRLLSGEIELKNAEKQVEGVL